MPDTTVIFKPEDGGERVETDLPTGAFEYHELKDYFVTYAAYPGERPVISGGTQINGWQKKENGKWEAPVNLTNVNELYVNGKRRTLARTPNPGYYLTDGQPNDSTLFKFKGKDIQPWKNLDQGPIRLVIRWGSVYNTISKIDVKKRLAYLVKPSPEIMVVPPKYYIENLEALMDTANEWYYDRNQKTIAFIPGKEITNPNEADIVIPKLSNLITVAGTNSNPVRNLRFYHLTFKNTKEGGTATLSATYAKNCEWIDNHIQNVGQASIRLGKGCYNNLISRNEINAGKGSGIVVSGDPKPASWNDVVSDNTISYNKITNLRPAVTGITVFNTIRSTVVHNYISNVGSYGITLGSWPNIEETSDGSHLAEYNHVSFTNMERDDEGGIAVYGLSQGSVVRRNLIHDVHPAATNENVGFFFQNMSLGWKVTDNIYYNLKQGEMKLCACYLSDNTYENNFIVPPPAIQPTEIIDGEPECTYAKTDVSSPDSKYQTGNDLTIRAEVFNKGATGMEQVLFYVDGKVAMKQLFPAIANNRGIMTFHYRFGIPGKHTVAVGTAPEKELNIEGEPLVLIYSNLKTGQNAIPFGDSIHVTFTAQNILNEPVTQKLELQANGKVVSRKEVQFANGEIKSLSLSYLPEKGDQSVTIGNLNPLKVNVFPVKEVNIAGQIFLTYCSTTAQPGKFSFDPKANHFEISAAGTDFLHAEDSYGTIYMKGAIKGNFVATVKVVQFSENISEWFRAGLFVRNDLAKSHASEKGSLGSFLMFSTTLRHGAQWDEFANGCMHNTKSYIYDAEHPIPVWLKLVRHGNSFSGYFSYDGKHWNLSRESGEIPGLAPVMDLGLAGGSNDQRVGKVVFEDFQLKVEESNTKP